MLRGQAMCLSPWVDVWVGDCVGHSGWVGPSSLLGLASVAGSEERGQADRNLGTALCLVRVMDATKGSAEEEESNPCMFPCPMS